MSSLAVYVGATVSVCLRSQWASWSVPVASGVVEEFGRTESSPELSDNWYLHIFKCSVRPERISLDRATPKHPPGTLRGKLDVSDFAARNCVSEIVGCPVEST